MVRPSLNPLKDFSYRKHVHYERDAGLALASSQIANGYLVSPLATEQRAGVAELA